MNVVVDSRVYFSKIFYERLTLVFSGIFCAFSFPRAAWECILYKKRGRLGFYAFLCQFQLFVR
jgi:hypothetical protein